MRNSDRQQFSYETFVAAMESDPRLQNIVTNYTKDKIEFKQSEVDDLNKPEQGADTVNQMATRATDVGATL